MKRILALLLLFLSALSGSAQHVVINSYRNQGVTAPFAFWGTLGDSQARGHSIPEVAGPTPTTGTVYEYNGTTLVEITDSDLNAAVGGSPWPKFGIDYHLATGQKVIFGNQAFGGSTITDTDDFGRIWSTTTTGSLYASAIENFDEALALPGVELGGFIISGGVNDLRNSTPPTVSEFKTAYINLIDRLNAKYNNPPIFLYQLTTVGDYDNPHNLIIPGRTAIVEIAELYDNVELAINTTGYRAQGYVSTDETHFTQAGNNKLGEQLNQYLELPSHLDERVKIKLNKFDTPISDEHQQAYTLFFESCIANGNINAIESLQIYVGSTKNNVCVDFGETIAIREVSATFQSHGYFETDGATNHIDVGYYPSYSLGKVTQDDVIIGVKIADNKTPSGTAGSAFGVTVSSLTTLLQQSSGGIAYRINDNTATSYASKTAFDDNKFYAVRRSGSTKYLYENKTQLNSAVVPSTGLPTRTLWLGARHNGTTTGDLRLNAQFEAFFVAKWSALNYDAFIDDLDELLTALKN